MKSIIQKVGTVSAKLASAVGLRQRKWTGPFVHFRSSPSPWPEDLKQDIEKDFLVFPEFITQEEHDNLMEEVEQTLKKRRYQPDHFDKVISGYKETEKTFWVRSIPNVDSKVSDFSLHSRF